MERVMYLLKILYIEIFIFKSFSKYLNVSYVIYIYYKCNITKWALPTGLIYNIKEYVIFLFQRAISILMKKCMHTYKFWVKLE